MGFAQLEFCGSSTPQPCTQRAERVDHREMRLIAA
jgi:hypothetical protein